MKQQQYPEVITVSIAELILAEWNYKEAGTQKKIDELKKKHHKIKYLRNDYCKGVRRRTL